VAQLLGQHVFLSGWKSMDGTRSCSVPHAGGIGFAGEEAAKRTANRYANRVRRGQRISCTIDSGLCQPSNKKEEKWRILRRGPTPFSTCSGALARHRQYAIFNRKSKT